jgi:pyrroline-5-carboxylate reductase
MDPFSIGFIGGGNMARSLAGGLVDSGWAPARIRIAEPDADKREALTGMLGVACTAENPAVAEWADVLVLAVKPQVLHEVCDAIAAAVQSRRPLVVSIAAGVRSNDIERWLGGNLPVVRVMPNTPALVGSGASALFANAQVSAGQRDRAESILRAVGVTAWLDDEPLMDAVTALSGSGPAYFFLLMEAIEDAGRELGLDADTARLLTLETAFGAAKLALESDDSPAELRRRVTSPGGTTEAALAALEQGGLREVVARALRAAADRGRSLADRLGAA